MQQDSFMLELQKIFLEAARKSGFSVLLLLVGMYGMYHVGSGELGLIRAELKQTEGKLEGAYMEIRKCDSERAALATQVEWLLDRLQSKYPEFRKRKYGN